MTVVVAVRKEDRAVIAADSGQSDSSMLVPHHFDRGYSNCPKNSAMSLPSCWG